ncbi:MAG: 1-phosphofructokinase [Lachnospiraceae bacterium]|nr:1-phosphofructokinase [Lachnospiraceae bacterium]MDE7360054.1 1-phosphofructokinase [Lachnospiraceae bacterium]
MNRIYTVTLNPSLDYTVSVDSFRLGYTNRTETELLTVGGKGINVSTVLHNLGLDSTALGFVAGFTGQEAERQLAARGIGNGLITLKKGLTRINVKLQSVEGTEINGQGPEIPEEKLALLEERLLELAAGDVLFLSGSIPSSLPEDTYLRMMERVAAGVLTVVDVSGEGLVNALPLHPFLVKPNQHELGEIFGVTFEGRQSVLPYAEKLREKGARNVLVSMAGQGAVLLAEDGSVFESPVPEGRLVNGVGAGDSMAAGFVAGWLEKQDYAHAFYMGMAAGSATAFSEGLADGEKIRELYRGMRGM